MDKMKAKRCEACKKEIPKGQLTIYVSKKKICRNCLYDEKKKLKIQFDNESIIKNGGKGLRNICSVCGKARSKKSNMCLACYKKSFHT